MKKHLKTFIITAICLAVVIVLFNSLFILNEDESAIVERFGQIVSVHVAKNRDELKEDLERYPVYSTLPVSEGAGLKFKIPFLDDVIIYSNKLMTYDTTAQDIIASDKKILYFDNNAQWRIDNPVLFRVSAGSMESAVQRIDNYLYSLMREKVGKLESTTVISDKAAIEEMLLELDKEVTDRTNDLGITVYDIRIKRTDFPQENYESIYNRMITERNRIAAQYRSEGEEQSIMIKSATDREVMQITSEAYKESETIKGEADSEAARIFNEAYNKDPEFFEFYTMLEAYRETIGSETVLVIPADSPFAKYLYGYGSIEP